MKKEKELKRFQLTLLKTIEQNHPYPGSQVLPKRASLDLEIRGHACMKRGPCLLQWQVYKKSYKKHFTFPFLYFLVFL